MVNHKTVSNKIRKTKSAVPAEDRFRHPDFCDPIIEESVWKQAQYLLKERAENKARAASGRRIHRYCGIIKCAECGASLIAQKRRWNGKEYFEYSCNSNHRYGKAYCTPHRVRESQLDELVLFEIQGLRDHIIAEAHPPELDEEYLDMLAAEAEEELKSEGRLEELERKYCLEEADSQK